MDSVAAASGEIDVIQKPELSLLGCSVCQEEKCHSELVLTVAGSLCSP